MRVGDGNGGKLKLCALSLRIGGGQFQGGPQHVIEPRGNAAVQNRPGAHADGSGLFAQPPIDDDVDSCTLRRIARVSGRLDVNANGTKNGRANRAVNVNLFVKRLVALARADDHRGKQPPARWRRPPTRRETAFLPQRRRSSRSSSKSQITGSLRADIRRGHEQQSPRRRLARHRLNQSIGGVSVDQLFERRAAIDARTPKSAPNPRECSRCSAPPEVYTSAS